MAVKPRPIPTEITVSIKRSFWTEAPKGTYELAVSITCAPDPEHTAAANLDITHRLVRGRLDAYLDEATGSLEPPAKSA